MKGWEWEQETKMEKKKRETKGERRLIIRHTYM